MIAIQDEVISTSNYIQHTFNDPSTTNDICTKRREKSETIQHITGACHILAQDEYTHRHNQVGQQCPLRTGYEMRTVRGTSNAVLQKRASNRVREVQL